MKPKRSETRHLGLHGETPTVWQKHECVTVVISHHRNDGGPCTHPLIDTSVTCNSWDICLIEGKGNTGACRRHRYVPHLCKLFIIHSTLLLCTLIDLRGATQIQFCLAFLFFHDLALPPVIELTHLTSQSILKEKDIRMGRIFIKCIDLWIKKHFFAKNEFTASIRMCDMSTNILTQPIWDFFREE